MEMIPNGTNQMLSWAFAIAGLVMLLRPWRWLKRTSPVEPSAPTGLPPVEDEPRHLKSA